MSLEKRLRALEESTPRGYQAFAVDGKPLIQSDLPGLEWMHWAEELFRSRAHELEKRELRRQLACSVGVDNGGGRLYELVAVGNGNSSSSLTALLVILVYTCVEVR